MYNWKNDIDECLFTLNRGGIILYPTDTVWGIGCDATNENTVSRIFSLKNRPDEKSMIILLADEKDIPKYLSQANPKIFDYIKGIHKPTTVIYEDAMGLAKNLINKDGSIAIRIVKDEFCKKLISSFGKPIVSTSANLSGYPAPANFNDIDIAIKMAVDYVVQYRQDDLTEALPSTIVKLNADGSIIILRP